MEAVAAVGAVAAAAAVEAAADCAYLHERVELREGLLAAVGAEQLEVAGQVGADDLRRHLLLDVLLCVPIGRMDGWEGMGAREAPRRSLRHSCGLRWLPSRHSCGLGWLRAVQALAPPACRDKKRIRAVSAAAAMAMAAAYEEDLLVPARVGRAQQLHRLGLLVLAHDAVAHRARRVARRAEEAADARRRERQ